jgi:hypothetical protein
MTTNTLSNDPFKNVPGLGQNDMTGMPGPDMAAGGVQPQEMNPATGVTATASAPVKSLVPVQNGSAPVTGTEAAATIPQGMLANQYVQSEEDQAIKAATATGAALPSTV